MRVLSRVIVIAVIATAAIGLSPRPVSACTCIGAGPPCEASFKVDAIVVGTVRAIDIRKVRLFDEIDRMFDQRLVHLSVERAVRGAQSATVDVWTGMGGGDCGYDFTIGVSYVVYAYRKKDGTLGTGICSRTRLLSEAREDLAFFSALPASGKGARVSGTIRHWENDPAAGRQVQYGGVPDVQVLVRGTAGVFSGMTDGEGKYAIDGVPPGAYETEVLPPPAFSRRSLRTTFEINDARACAIQDFALHYAGRVAGSVLDAAGQPAAGVRVEIAPAGARDEPLYIDLARSKTDANGQFELGDIPPGSYVAGVGLTPEMDATTVYTRTLFPETIEIGKGNRVEIGVLRLPAPSRRYEIKGVAVDAAGAPVAGASVILQGPRARQAAPGVTTAADGSFTLPVFEGQTYTVRAFINVSTNPFRQAQAVQPLVVSGDPPPIRLMLVVR